MPDHPNEGPHPLSPGPGSYNPIDHLAHQRSPVYDFGNQQERPRAAAHDVPGPGMYDAKHDQKYVNLSYKIPQGNRMSPMSRDQRLNPGPAHYQSVKDLFGKDGIKVRNLYLIKQQYTIGQRSPSIPFADLPGPGFYPSRKPFFEEALKFTIGHKRERSAGNANPGPGYYNPRDTLVKPSSPMKSISNA